MICSICKKGETSVVDSRPTEDGTAIRRRRLCVCGARFTTFERVQYRELMVVKKNGRKSAFDRDKLAKSIYIALKKRPLDTETLINSVKKTNRLITVEESWPFGSVGSEIANIVQRDAFDYLDSPVIKVNSADVPMPYSLSLEKLYLPQVDDIINAAKKVSYIK